MRAKKVAATVEIPDFNSEREEAEWWDEHGDEMVMRAEAAGAVGRGVLLPSRPTTIRLIAGDVERARAIAERKGLRYQTYLKMLIHEALGREEKAS